MSDTPETDMLVMEQALDCVPYDESAADLAQLARKLERERNEALKQVSDCGSHMIQVSEELNAGAGEITLDAAIRAMARLQKAERERDAALNRLKEIELLWEEAQYEMDEMI